YLAAKLAEQGKTSRPKSNAPQRPLTPDERVYHEKRINEALESISRLGDGQRHAGLLKYAPIVFGSALLFDKSPEELGERIEPAYDLSGDSHCRNEVRTGRESLDYARAHPYELRRLDTHSEGPEFEEQVNIEVRRRLTRQAADAKLSPIKERHI